MGTPGCEAALDCLLIADDLTGACDAAVHFAARGYRSRICVSALEFGDARVIGVNTESRDVAGDEAELRLKAAGSRLAHRCSKILFKKIDSTLRGNVGREIQAALAIFEYDAAIVCPAFPAQNRVVENRCLRISSDLGFDPVDIPALLREQGLEGCAHSERGAIARTLDSGARVVSVDGVSDDDLDRIVAEGLAVDRRVLWVGSGGLAAALARTLPRQAAADRQPVIPGPVLFCIGSDHAVTVAQQGALVASRPVRKIPWDAASRDEIRKALAEGQHVCLRIPRSPVCAGSILELVGGAPAAAIFLSGGDTALLVVKALGVHSIELYDEIVAGIPRGVLRGGEFEGTAAATKAGGFGRPDALIQVADYFSCNQ